MSEILKTEAVVLSKMNYGDSSLIATLFTEEAGKLSAIIKGGRNPKSKINNLVDPLNHLQVILYRKETRDLQLISDADMISHYPIIKENLESLKYSFAVVELVKNLSPENEANKKLFDGLIRILTLLNSSNEHPGIIFGRFFLFYISELGYRLLLDRCSVCNNSVLANTLLGYNYENGLLCNNCKEQGIINYEISPELFNYFLCLKHNKRVEKDGESLIKNSLIFFESYLKYHIADFKGIQSLRSF